MGKELEVEGMKLRRLGCVATPSNPRTTASRPLAGEAGRRSKDEAEVLER